MYTDMNLLTIFTGLLLYVLTNGKKICPLVPQDEISKCLNSMGIAGDAEMAAGSVLISDTARARKVCSDGSLDRAISCMEDVFTACIKHKEKHILEKLVNVERWRTGMNLLCDNLNSVIENDRCIKDSNIQSEVCVVDESLEFKTKLQAKVMEGESSPEDIMTFSCRYADKIVDCMRKPLVALCPAEIKNVMMDVVKSFMPPICDPYWGSADVSESTVTRTSITLFILSVLMQTLVYW